MCIKIMPLLLLACTIPAFAKRDWYREFGVSGNTLIAVCNPAIQKIDDPHFQGTKQDRYDAGYCEGFIAGIADNMNEDDGVSLNEPGITLRLLIRVVQQYMNDHPEQLDKPASYLIRQALIKAFPRKAEGVR